MKTAAIAAACGLLIVSSPASAERTADYAMDEARFAELAAKLEVTGFRPMPERGAVDVELGDIKGIDHQLSILGIFCSAWKVENPLSQMVTRALGAWDRDGELTPAAAGETSIRLTLDAANSMMRCVQIGELKTRCLISTSITGTASRMKAGVAENFPVVIDISQEQKMSGACNGLAQGSSLAGRGASLALVDRLAEIAAAP